MEERSNMATKDNKEKEAGAKITDSMTPEQKEKAMELKKEAEGLGLKVVDPNALEQILTQLKAVQEQNQELSKKIDETADQSRLALYDKKQGGRLRLQRVVRLNVRDVRDKETNETEEKVIVGWKMIVDRVDKNPANNVWTETQIVEVIYQDDTKEQMPYTSFVAESRFVNATIENRRKEEPWVDDKTIGEDGEPLYVEYAGAEVLTVRRQDNGETLDIDATFVN